VTMRARSEARRVTPLAVRPLRRVRVSERGGGAVEQDGPHASGGIKRSHENSSRSGGRRRGRRATAGHMARSSAAEPSTCRFRLPPEDRGGRPKVAAHRPQNARLTSSSAEPVMIATPDTKLTSRSPHRRLPLVDALRVEPRFASTPSRLSPSQTQPPAQNSSPAGFRPGIEAVAPPGTPCQAGHRRVCVPANGGVERDNDQLQGVGRRTSAGRTHTP
jgi:hypothetical protein